MMISLSRTIIFTALVVGALCVPFPNQRTSMDDSPLSMTPSMDTQDDSSATTDTSYDQLSSTDTATDDSATSGDIDPAVVLISQQSTVGMLENLIARTMLEQCNNNLQPALDFYTCVENTTDLPQLWAAMGLNATLLRIRTLDITTVRGNNVSEKVDTYVTIADTSDSDDTTITLKDLLTKVVAQTRDFCRTVDSLLNCMDPYLMACFPQSTSTSSDQLNQLCDPNDVDCPQTSTTTTTTTTDTSTTTTDMDSDQEGAATETVTDSTDSQPQPQPQAKFFNIPMMYYRDQITVFIQQTFDAMCSNDAAGFQLALNSVPCMMTAVEQMDRCQQWDDAAASIRMTMDANNSTGPNPDVCGAMKNAAECHLDLADETCGQEVADLGQHLYQLYFQSVDCIEQYGSETVVQVRQPFNQLAAVGAA